MGQYDYLEESTKKEIRKEVKLILKELSIVEPPINYKEILGANKIQYDLFSDFDPYYREFRKKISKQDADKIRGALIVGEKHMLIKNDKYAKRINFTFGHEIAHWRLKWHRELLYFCSEFDLSLAARRQLEREANYFANRLGFLGQFNEHLADIQLSLRGIKELSDTFNLSVEASLRSAVEEEDRQCALIVLTPEKGKGLFISDKIYCSFPAFFRKIWRN